MTRAVLGAFLALPFLGHAAIAQTCSNYPYTLANGTTADADQVMGNFNAILSCANTKLLPSTYGTVTGQLVFNAPPSQEVVAFKDSTHSAFTFDMQIGQYSGGTTVFQTLNTTAWELESGLTPAIFVSTAGNVGIKTTSPSYPLYVNGTAYATGAAGALSDRRHKTDIAPLDLDALDVVARLKPVTFLWKDPQDGGMKGQQIGFIAQDVLPVLPDVVLIENNAEKTLGLKYDGLIPVLTKAIQQQQSEIADLKRANIQLAQNMRRLELRLSKLEIKRTAQK